MLTARWRDGWTDGRSDRHDEVNSLLRHISKASKTAWYNVKHRNTLYRHLQNFLVLNYTVPNYEKTKSSILCKKSLFLGEVNVSVKMSTVAYSCDTVIMLYAIYLKLMYRYFNKTYVLMLCAVLFSLFQYASTIVTYMIVLVQFDQSEHSHYECSRNVTNWVTWSLELVCVMWPRELHNFNHYLYYYYYYYYYHHLHYHRYNPGITML